MSKKIGGISDYVSPQEDRITRYGEVIHYKTCALYPGDLKVFGMRVRGVLAPFSRNSGGILAVGVEREGGNRCSKIMKRKVKS